MKASEVYDILSEEFDWLNEAFISQTQDRKFIKVGFGSEETANLLKNRFPNSEEHGVETYIPIDKE